MLFLFLRNYILMHSPLLCHITETFIVCFFFQIEIYFKFLCAWFPLSNQNLCVNLLPTLLPNTRCLVKNSNFLENSFGKSETKTESPVSQFPKSIDFIHLVNKDQNIYDLSKKK